MDNCIYNSTCELYHTDVCNNSCIRYIEMNSLLKNSRIPKNMQRIIDLYPDNCDLNSFIQLKQIKDNIDEYISDNQLNLYIYSRFTGNGKTSWAIKLMLKYFDKIWVGNGLKPRGLFLNVPTFLLKLKDFNNIDMELQQIKKLIPEVDLIIWDDISSTKLSDYDNSQLLSYIDERILSGKANIFTSNVNEETLKDVLGNRLSSRIWNNSIKIELKGTDRRGETVD